MVPLGWFVAACPHFRRPSRSNVQCFTLTAYDPVMGQYIAMGHSSPVKLEGQSLYHADGEIPTEGGAVENVTMDGGRMVGIVTRQEAIGVSGPFYGGVPAWAAILTSAPRVGKAWLMSSLLPGNGAEVEIISVSASGGFSFRAKQRLVKGMSGSPILQDGEFVGLLWGSRGEEYEGRAVEVMADRLMDAWANKPDEPQKRPARRLSDRAIRREIQNLTKKVAEAQAEAVGAIFGPEVAERVRQSVENQGVAAGTAAIRALKEADGK